MSPERITVYVLWVLPAVVQVAIVVAMLRRKLYLEFPIFFSWAAYHVLRAGSLWFLQQQGPRAYFYGYWSAQVISFGLGFAVIYEILRHVLRRYDALWGLGRRLFLGIALLLVLAAVARATATSTAEDLNVFIARVYAWTPGLRMAQCGLLAFLILFSTYFGITWRHYVFGIALGFGLYASVELAATAVRSEVGWIGHETYDLVRRVAYACATLIWAAYLLRPEPARLVANRVPQTQVEEWNRALQELWQR